MTPLKHFCLYLLLLTLAGCGAGFAPAPAAERSVEIGMLLRRQFTADPYEPRIYRHIDTLLPDGEIYGFNTAAAENSIAENLLFRTPGVVRDTARMRAERPYYLDLAAARDFCRDGKCHLHAVTDWVKFNVTPAQAAALRRAWQELRARPPEFRLSGMNCATRAMACFARAGILPPVGIPGIDRPENLRQIVRRYYPDARILSGYFWLDENNQPQISPLE
ncbi:hypothetical protein AGMMS49959_03210 [Planctomycetales bacterium]|nr:hypothetical protein AGMMS49959_03210 [Planctomycetales bacterium]